MVLFAGVLLWLLKNARFFIMRFILVDLKRFDSRRELRTLVGNSSRVPPARDSLLFLIRISE